MNLFKRRKVEDMPAPQKESLAANSNWDTYREGAGDKAGRKIEKLYAVAPGYVIYFIDSDLFYDITPELQNSLGSVNLGNADAALARINRLLDKNQTKGSTEYKFNFSILELAADALEMVFC